MKKKGFTLIELLVVIAIIGILAGIVLASLGTARRKATDAGIQSQVAALRSAAEIYASDNNNQYTGVFTSGNQCANAGSSDAAVNINKLITDAITKCNTSIGGSCVAGLDYACRSSAGSWAAAVRISPTATYWCSDSSGRAQTINSLTAVTGSNACQ